MKDVIEPLERAYTTALKLTGEKAYNGQVPDELKGNYIFFGSFSINENRLNSHSSVNVTSEVRIYTEGDQYNSGQDANTIAGKVLEQLYENNSHNLILPTGLQMVNTELVSDRKDTWRLKSQVVAVDRTIVLRHIIFIK